MEWGLQWGATCLRLQAPRMGCCPEKLRSVAGCQLPVSLGGGLVHGVSWPGRASRPANRRACIHNIVRELRWPSAGTVLKSLSCKSRAAWRRCRCGALLQNAASGGQAEVLIAATASPHMLLLPAETVGIAPPNLPIPYQFFHPILYTSPGIPGGAHPRRHYRFWRPRHGRACVVQDAPLLFVVGRRLSRLCSARHSGGRAGQAAQGVRPLLRAGADV